MLASSPSDLAMQLNILTPKQMLQRLPKALAQVKWENLLNEIRQIIFYLYQPKEITKEVSSQTIIQSFR